MNVVSLGARVRAVGRVGNDEEGAFFSPESPRSACGHTVYFYRGQYHHKNKGIRQHQQFIRIDEETVTAPSKSVTERISAELDAILSGVTVVVLSDYAKGIFD